MRRLVEAIALFVMVVSTVRIGMSANQSKIDIIADKIEKARDEIVAGIDDLKAQVERGEELDFSRLENGAQELDDLHEDPAVVEPVETPETPETPAEHVTDEPVELPADEPVEVDPTA